MWGVALEFFEPFFIFVSCVANGGGSWSGYIQMLRLDLLLDMYIDEHDVYDGWILGKFLKSWISSRELGMIVGIPL